MRPELRYLFLFNALAIATAVIILLLRINSLLVVVLLAAVYSLFFMRELERRRREINRLCEKLDRILYEDIPWELDEYREGELSILQDKVQKLTIRLREQTGIAVRERQLQERLMTDISHQLKTPLTSMELIVSRLRSGELTPSQQHKQLFELSRLIENIDELIVMLLKIAKLESGTAYIKNESVNISRLIDRSLEPLAVSMDIHGIKLRQNGDAGASFMGDAEWTAQALTNIFKNSIEHMENDGCIDVNWCENAIYSEICIEDNGSGIPADELQHVFDRFWRGSGARHSGFGVGMSFARSIIASQNGTIKAANAHSGGARFTVRFYKQDTGNEKEEAS